MSYRLPFRQAPPRLCRFRVGRAACLLIAAAVLLARSAPARADRPDAVPPHSSAVRQADEAAVRLPVAAVSPAPLIPRLQTATPVRPAAENMPKTIVRSPRLTTRSMLLLAGYALLIAFASLLGGGLFGVLRLTHTGMQLTMSAVGGLMLGIAFFQLLPHAVYQTQSLNAGVYSLTAGLVFMFLLIRVFHFHAHDAAVEEPQPHPHGPGCSHDHDHDAGPSAHELSWLGVAIGLGIHTLIDGIALGAAILGTGANTAMLAGVGTFVAIALHKPLDALSITSVMAAAGQSRRNIVTVNLAFALMCPLGAALFLLGVTQFSSAGSYLTGLALGFSAGAFLCIALGDLLPELEFHQHDRGKLTVALLGGLAAAFLIERFSHPGGGHVMLPAAF